MEWERHWVLYLPVQWDTFLNFLVELVPRAVFLSWHTMRVTHVDCISLVPRSCSRKKMWSEYEVIVIHVWLKHVEASYIIECLCYYMLTVSLRLDGWQIAHAVPLLCFFVCRAGRFGWAHAGSWLVEPGSHPVWDPHWQGDGAILYTGLLAWSH